MIRSPILTTAARPLLVAALALSLWMLLRGHNEPGGGFVGGLLAAAGLVIVGLAEGTRALRRILPIRPPVLAGLGLLAALASGLIAMPWGAPVLVHLWGDFGIGAVTLKLGTTLLFDAGVYLVVLGTILAVLGPFLER